jgi:hypothetical protein
MQKVAWAWQRAHDWAAARGSVTEKVPEESRVQGGQCLAVARPKPWLANAGTSRHFNLPP